jgi:biopolymer transport protein ExbD
MSWNAPALGGQAPGGVLPRRREPDRHDRLIPMINVVFLLLLFFVIAGTFRAADALRVEPPEAAGAGTFDPASLTLVVGPAGEMAFGEATVDMTGAVAGVRDWLEAHPGGDIQIKADRRVRASVVVPLLAELATAGIANIRLVAVRPEAAE